VYQAASASCASCRSDSIYIKLRRKNYELKKPGKGPSLLEKPGLLGKRAMEIDMLLVSATLLLSSISVNAGTSQLKLGTHDFTLSGGAAFVYGHGAPTGYRNGAPFR
jgi:hypothetical protein